MHRTTILLPEALKSACEEFARSRKMSLGELIRQQLIKVLESPSDAGGQDALFASFVPYSGKAPSNLALAHDEELYGALPSAGRSARVRGRKSK